jgi:metal transporter CNNM
MASYNYVVFHGGPWIAMASIAGVLLVISSLLAGLTLAVCGLDITLLQLQTVTGTAKERWVSSSDFD